jgi:salicylate hydroxylase
MHDYETGETINDYDLSDYKEKWGYEYYMFHRQDMHATLLKTACGEQGVGPAAQLFVNHKASSIDVEDGRITFENGKTVHVDLIIGADGVRVSFA